MHKALFFLWLPLLVAAPIPSVTTADPAEKVDWGKVIGADVNTLTTAQKSQAESNLLRLMNTWGCKGTLAACMATGDLTARRHAGFVLRAVRKGKDDAFITRHLALRQESAHPKEVAALDVSERPMRGTKGAPVTLVAFECFQCPFCGHLAPQLKELDKKFKGKISEYFKYYPVRSHQRGVASALAAAAAHKQGKFWPMYDMLFANRTALSDVDLMGYAKKIGLNLQNYNNDIQDPSLMKIIEKDKLEGMRFGVDGTPTFFINGKRYQAQYELEEIIDRIEEELDIVEGRIPK